MTWFRNYLKGDPENVASVSRKLSTAVIDPGTDGVVLGWDDGVQRWPRQPDWRRTVSNRASGHRDAARSCGHHGVDLLIVEDQYIGHGKGVRAQINLIRNAGILVGHILERARCSVVVWTPPSHWQTILPPGKDTKDRAMRHAAKLLGPRWLAHQGPTTLQEACADVVGMMAWFEELTRHGPKHD